MVNKTNPIVLQGIIEADETYISGRPRKKNKKEDREPAPRGRGTSKTTVIGVVERGGQVIAEVAKGSTGRDIMQFIRRVMNVKESELITDEYHAYNALSSRLKHHVVNHQEQYGDGNKHTNTIEGGWSLLVSALLTENIIIGVSICYIHFISSFCELCHCLPCQQTVAVTRLINFVGSRSASDIPVKVDTTGYA